MDDLPGCPHFQSDDPTLRGTGLLGAWLGVRALKKHLFSGKTICLISSIGHRAEHCSQAGRKKSISMALQQAGFMSMRCGTCWIKARPQLSTIPRPMMLSYYSSAACIPLLNHVDQVRATGKIFLEHYGHLSVCTEAYLGTMGIHHVIHYFQNERCSHDMKITIPASMVNDEK